MRFDLRDAGDDIKGNGGCAGRKTGCLRGRYYNRCCAGFLFVLVLDKFSAERGIEDEN